MGSKLGGEGGPLFLGDIDSPMPRVRDASGQHGVVQVGQRCRVEVEPQVWITAASIHAARFSESSGVVQK